jgi:gluconolactonase
MLVLPLAAQQAPQQHEEFNELRIERMVGNYRFADGPVWSPERKLLFTDLPANTVYVWVPGHKVEPLRKDLQGALGLTFDAQERMYVCESKGRRVIRQDKKGKVEVVADKWEGKKLNGPNDIVVRKDGNVYFTDSPFGSTAMKARELDFHGVFHVNPKGELQVVAKWKSGRPNGIAVSPNGRVLYVSNSDERSISAFDLDNKSGVASNERILIRGIAGAPAGIRCDEKGNLYIAGNGLLIYTPEGKLIRQVELSDTPSNLAFGEADLQSLFVTTRRMLFRVRVPYRGSLPYFAVTAPTIAP